MGQELTLNYIVKTNNADDLKEIYPGKQMMIYKMGQRHFMMHVPLYLADHEWNIVGICIVHGQHTSTSYTNVQVEILVVLSKQERDILTHLNQIGQKEVEKLNKRKNEICPLVQKHVDYLNETDLVIDPQFGLLLSGYVMGMKTDKVTIAYVNNGYIDFQGYLPGKGNFPPVAVVSEHNFIGLDENGEITTNIRGLNFETKSGIKGIAFNQFDLID